MKLFELIIITIVITMTIIGLVPKAQMTTTEKVSTRRIQMAFFVYILHIFIVIFILADLVSYFVLKFVLGLHRSPPYKFLIIQLVIMLHWLFFKGLCYLSILENKILDRPIDHIYNVFSRKMELYTLQRRLRYRFIILAIWVMVCVVVYKNRGKS